MGPTAFGIREILAAVPEQQAAEWLTLELPAPPTINQKSVHARLGNEAPKVKRWRKAADAYLLWTKQHKKLGSPLGKFEIAIVWDRSVRGDIDNRVKYLLDYLERLQVFRNDADCEFLTVGRGCVMPDGCRVRLRSWGGA